MGNACRHLLHLFQAGIKKHPVRFAPHISVYALPRHCFAAALTAATAQEIIPALPAGRIQRKGAFYEFDLHPCFIQLCDPVLIQIAEPVLIQHVKIAGIDTAIRFHHILDATGTMLVTGLRRIACEHPDPVFKLTDIRLAVLLPVPIPEMEEANQEIAILFC